MLIFLGFIGKNIFEILFPSSRCCRSNRILLNFLQQWSSTAFNPSPPPRFIWLRGQEPTGQGTNLCSAVEKAPRPELSHRVFHGAGEELSRIYFHAGTWKVGMCLRGTWTQKSRICSCLDVWVKKLSLESWKLH